MHIFLPTGTPFFIAYSFVFKKKKKERNTQSLSVFVASTSSVLYWHCDNALWQRISGKRSLQVLCICQVSSKWLTQGADWRKITKQKKKSFFTFLKTWALQNSSSKTLSEPASQPNVNFSAMFVSEIQTSIQQPSAHSWSLNSIAFSLQNGLSKLNVNKAGQQLIRFLNYIC